MRGRVFRSLLLVSLPIIVLIMALPANGVIFNVDDDSSAATPGWEATISGAIDSVSAGDTIHVYPGTYSEALNIDKQLWVLGQEYSDSWTPGTPGASAGAPTIDYDGAIPHMICIDADGVVFKGFRVYCDGAATRGIYFGAVNGDTVHGDTIMYCTFDADATGDNLRYITIADNRTLDGGLKISYNKFNVPASGHSNCFTVGEGGVLTGVNGLNEFSHNEVYGSATQMNTSQLRLTNQGNICDLTYSHNLFDKTDAILLQETGGSAVGKFGDIVVRYNDFTETSSGDADYAFMILNNVEDSDFEGGSLTLDDVILRYNNFKLDVSGTFEVVSNDVPTPTQSIDARYNYWNTYDGPSGQGPGSGADISTNVEYSPWLGFQVGTSPMTFHVDTTGPIQDALDSCQVGDTVRVHDGTYTENLTMDKDSVVLIAASSPVIDGSGAPAPCIDVNADSVVIAGFTIQKGTSGIYFDAVLGGLVTLCNIKNNACPATKNFDGCGVGVYCFCSGPVIEANDIDSNWVGVKWECGGGKMPISGLPAVNFNNIFANENYGVENAIIVKGLQLTIDAKRNYWGASDGPTLPAPPDKNISLGPGSGDKISLFVDYEPWFADTVKNEELITAPGTDTTDAKSTANTEVIKEGDGTPAVSVGLYPSNPGGPHSFKAFDGSFIDVHIDDTTGVDVITIQFYYPDTVRPESGLALWWWNEAVKRSPGEWVLCSNQGVNTANFPPNYGGYIWARITDSTIPSLDDLKGAPIAGGLRGGAGGPIVPFYPPIAFVIFVALVALATVIYLRRRKVVVN